MSHTLFFTMLFFQSLTTGQHVSQFGIDIKQLLGHYQLFVPATIQIWYQHVVYEWSGILQGSKTVSDDEFEIVGSCVYSSDPPKVIIDNTIDDIHVDSVWFEIQNGTRYGVTGICISQQKYTEGTSYGSAFSQYYLNDDICGSNYKHYDSICIDNGLLSCEPSKQIIYFDITRPGTYIQDAIWESGTGLNTENLGTCEPTASPVPSLSPTDFPSTPTTQPSESPTYSPSTPTMPPTEHTNAPTTTGSRSATFGISNQASEQNGATVIMDNATNTTLDGNHWIIESRYQNNWPMLINLDSSSWGFHESLDSTITMTLSGSNSVEPDEDLLLAFSVNGNQYIGLMLTLDNNTPDPDDGGYCDNIMSACYEAIPSGDVYANVVNQAYSDSRQGNLFHTGYNCGSPEMRNYWPTTISITNRPSDDEVLLKISNPSTHNTQNCTFLSSFVPNSGMQIYIGGDNDKQDPVTFDQINVTYSIDAVSEHISTCNYLNITQTDDKSNLTNTTFLSSIIDQSQHQGYEILWPKIDGSINCSSNDSKEICIIDCIESHSCQDSLVTEFDTAKCC